MFNFKYEVKKNTMLQIFFMIQNLNPIFYELLIDAIKGSNKNLVVQNKRVIEMVNSNKTITLFPIYLNLFSTKKINTQKNEKLVYIESNRRGLIKEKQRLLSKVMNKKLEAQCKVFFINIYLNRYDKVNTSQLVESTQILQNLRML